MFFRVQSLVKASGWLQGATTSTKHITDNLEFLRLLIYVEILVFKV